MNEPVAPAPRIVSVLGMHRSGTSAITRALVALGVDLGDELMPGQRDNNAKGFFEDLEISALNIQLMDGESMGWDSLLPYDIGTELRHARPDLLVRAVDLLRQKTQATALFGMKDPRLCRLLPFWREAARQASLPMSCIVCLRDPLSVAASLSKRDGFRVAKSVYLWLLHTVSALEHSSGGLRILVSFDALLASPARELQRIASLLGIPTPCADDPAYVEFCDGFLDASMRHASHSLDDVMSSIDIVPAAKKLYAALCKHVSGDIELDAPEVLDALRDARMALDDQASLLAMVTASDAALEDLRRKDLERPALYWSGPDEDFDEKQSIACMVDVHADAVATLTLGETASAVSRFRLDPLEGPGVFVVFRLAVIDADGAVLQRIGPGDIARCSAGLRVWWLDEQSFLGVCEYGDPGLEFNLPGGARGMSFVLRRPTPEDLLLLEQSGQVRADEAQRLAIERAERIDVVERALDTAQELVAVRSGELERVSAQCQQTQHALEAAQSMAIQRAGELKDLHGKLDTTETALYSAQRLALERAQQIDVVQRALDAAQELVAARSGELERVSVQLQQTQLALDTAQSIAIQRAGELKDLHGKLDTTETALYSTQRLALERAQQIDVVQRALDAAQELVAARSGELERVSVQLQQTQLALDAAQSMAIQRAGELKDLHGRLDTTEAALRGAQQLALERAEQLDTLRREHDVVQASLADSHRQLQDSHAEAARLRLTLESITGFWAWRLFGPLWRFATRVRRTGPDRKR